MSEKSSLGAGEKEEKEAPAVKTPSSAEAGEEEASSDRRHVITERECALMRTQEETRFADVSETAGLASPSFLRFEPFSPPALTRFHSLGRSLKRRRRRRLVHQGRMASTTEMDVWTVQMP